MEELLIEVFDIETHQIIGSAKVPYATFTNGEPIISNADDINLKVDNIRKRYQKQISQIYYKTRVMSQSRITEIDKQIEKLQAEKEKLEAIEKLPEIEQKVKDYLERTYNGKRLLELHSLDEKGPWKITGEDPNCDMGGSHHTPYLGIFDGTLKEAIEYGVMQPRFYAWGGGGDFEKIQIMKPNGI
jgi:hypothetical protein